MDKEAIRSIEGVTGQWADAWVALTIAGDGEYILERPVLKAFGKA